MDKQFLAEMLDRYYAHLETVVTAINSNVKAYEKSIVELTRLAEFKPAVYLKELERVKQKIVEADIKLSHIVPRMKKIEEQIEILKQ